MSDYYQQVRSLVASFSLKHLHPHLDKIILSYIIYESLDFQEWFSKGENWQYEVMFKNNFEREKITIWKINANYGMKEYLLNPEKYSIKQLTDVNIDISSLKQFFDFWHYGDCSQCICFCVSLILQELNEIEPNKEYFALMMFPYRGIGIILGETIEQVYTNKIPYRIEHNPFPLLSSSNCQIERSKIRITDSNDYGFSFIDVDRITFSLPYYLNPMGDKLYYYKGYTRGSIDLNPLCDKLYYYGLSERDKEYNFIIRLTDGRWLSYHTNYEVDIHYSLICAIERICGVDEFLRYQANFNLNKHMKKLRKIKMKIKVND